MRHRKHKVTLDRPADQRRHLLRNLVTSLVLHERVRTTVAKAKAVRPLVEQAVTIGKVNHFNSRRALNRRLATVGAVRKVIEVLGPRYQSRPGGYTRITRVGVRKGDGAEEAVLEFVQ